MIEELQQLSQAIGTLSMNDARQIVDAVNRRLDTLLHPLMVKLYWREEAEESGIILNPISYIDKTGGAPPQRFQVTGTTGGALSWVFQNEVSLWLESIRTLDLTKQIKNKLTGKELSSEFLLFRTDVDSTMVTPLTIRGEVYGVYSFELQQSGILTTAVLDLLRRLGNSLALIIWNADTHEFNQEQTSRAIAHFLDSIRDFAFDSVFLGENYRSGFIARPFTDEFSDVEQKLNELLRKRGIDARHYEPDGGTQYMIEEIMKRIRSSHFCVADITGSNPNVLAEVGMMMILQKRFLLLRRKGDDAPRPFNLNQYPLYEYEITVPEGEMNVWSPGESKFQSFGVVLDKFTSDLPPETGFFSAEKRQ